MRALVAVHVLNHGLVCIDIIERHLRETGANPDVQQVAAVQRPDFPQFLSRSRREAEMSKLGRLGDAAGVPQPGQAGADRHEHAEGFVVSDGEQRTIRDKEREP
jgi:hypothetical protein